MSNDVPAGWYPDPHDTSRRRFWNGVAWTEHVDSPSAPPPPSAPVPTAPLPTAPLPTATVSTAAWSPSPSVGREFWRRPWVIAAAGFVALVAVAAAVSNNRD